LSELETPANGFEVEIFRDDEASGDVTEGLVFSCRTASPCSGFNSRWGRPCLSAVVPRGGRAVFLRALHARGEVSAGHARHPLTPRLTLGG
jgi:hypothetical protein